MSHTKILAFKKPRPKELLSPPLACKAYKPSKKLEAPDMRNDFYLKLMDWGSSDVLSLALGNTVFLWNASDSSASELLTVDEEDGPVASVRWISHWFFNNSNVHLCYGHQTRVGSLAWNNHILTTGGMDGRIINNDVQVKSHIVSSYMGHREEVCGLKSSPSGQQLASCRNDNLIHIWDTSNSTTRWPNRLAEHSAGVKALAWCPFHWNLLAFGGDDDDQCIKVWNTQTWLTPVRRCALWEYERA